MSFFRDIIQKGKDYARERFATDITYTRGSDELQFENNSVSNTKDMAKEFFIPGRGFSDEEINNADVGFKDGAIGAVKTAGEIAQGAFTLTHMLGNKVADTILPGFNSEKAAASRDKLNQPISEALAPSNAAQAKAMRVGDIGGLVVPAGTVSKTSKVDDLLKAINNTDGIAVNAGRTAENGAPIVSVSTDNLINPVIDAADADSVKFFENIIQRDGVDALGPIEVRVATDGSVEVVDGAKRLEAIRNVQPDELVDVVVRQDDAVATAANAAPAASKTDDVVTMAQSANGNALDIKQPNVGERSFSRRVSDSMPDAEIEPELFERRNTVELSQKAKNLLDEEPEAAQKVLDDIRNGENLTDTNVAVASEKLNRIRIEAEQVTDPVRRNELYDQAAELANDTARRLTEQGRSIQAATLYGRLTPEGQARFAARSIQKWNADNPTKKIPELTGGQTEEITRRMREIQKMPDGEEKMMKQFELQNYITDLTPTPFMQKIANTWKAGLLTGLKTTGLNITSNTAHNALEVIKDIPAAGVDGVASLFTGERTKVATMRGAIDGIRQGTHRGVRYFSTGFDERNIGQKLDYHRVNYGSGPVAKAFQTYTDTVFRFIGAQDQPFYYATLSRSLMDQSLAQAKNKGLKGDRMVQEAYKIAEEPTEEMIRYAVTDATTAVFQNKTALGRAAKTIQNIPGIGQFIVPFAQTPSAVAMQILNYSPVGAVKTIIENVGKGKFDQRAFSNGIGRSIVGTAPLVIGAEMYKNGLISLDYPGGDERQIELDRAEGRSYNAFRTGEGEEWRSVMTLGPAGNLILMGAFFQEAIEQSGSPTEAMVQAGLGAANSFTEQTFLTGVTNFTNAISDPQRYAETFLPNLTASFIPTIVSDVAQVGDEQVRESRGDTFAETFVTRAQNRVPGLRNELPARVDALGNQTPRGGNALETMLDPTRPSQDRSNELTTELRRLMDQAEITGNTDLRVAPTKIGSSKGYESLEREQEQVLYEVVGGLVNQKLTALIGVDGYQSLSDEQKAKQISKITERAQIEGRARFVMSLTDGVSLEEERMILGSLKEEGLITEGVFRDYTKLRNGQEL